MQPNSITRQTLMKPDKDSPAVATDILNASVLQRDISLLCVDAQLIIQQPPEGVHPALGCCIMDGRAVLHLVLYKWICPLLYQKPGSKAMPASTQLMQLHLD